ncbi:MAG: ABC transporter permease [Polyangiaceae bacterium]|nr:ABC transporter permease [Polyangiaceae bacterium]
MPLLLVGVVGLVFLRGHPFERKRIAVLRGGEGVAAALARMPEVKVRGATTEQEALGLLRSREVVGVVRGGPEGVEVIVGERDELLGRGMAAAAGARWRAVAAPTEGFVHFLVPGLLMFSALVSGFFGIGYPMVRYRQGLFLKKLATTPLGRGTFLASQVLARTALALGQAALMLGVARAAFGFPLPWGALGWVTLVVTLAILVFMALGLVLACFVRDEAAMVDAINVLMMPFALLSEVFFPADELPGPLPALAGLLPSTQLVRLLRAILLQGARDLEALGPGLLVVLAWLLLCAAVSLSAFRWTD